MRIDLATVEATISGRITEVGSKLISRMGEHRRREMDGARENGQEAVGGMEEEDADIWPHGGAQSASMLE